MVESSIVNWISQNLTRSPLYVSISISWDEMTHRIWPNQISNPIHGNPCLNIFEDRQDLRCTPIQFQIPILRLAYISISRNEIMHRIRPNPISNPIHINPSFDIFEHICKTSDIPQSNSNSQYLGLPSYQYLEMKYYIGYDPIQFPIQYMETPVSTSLNICKTSDIPQFQFQFWS